MMDEEQGLGVRVGSWWVFKGERVGSRLYITNSQVQNLTSDFLFLIIKIVATESGFSGFLRVKESGVRSWKS